MQRVGRYEILGELGRGAMGVVYRAQDPVIGRTVAIKTIRLGEMSDANELQRLRDRLLREARSAGILSHPHIVTIYDIGQEADTAYIAMEFVNGNTLEQRMRGKGPLPKQEILTVLVETASALDFAHQKGIIHRDIKPANIMVTDTGAVKITDFGVAKILSHQITQADTVLGTPSYMSPEQIEARPIDGRSDQFALAVIAYQLLTGEKPFMGDTLPALLFKIVKEDPPPPHRLNASLGEEVDAVLRRAMAKVSTDRFGTCAEFAQALVTGLGNCPDWQPMGRGMVHSMPTINSDQNATVTVMRTTGSGQTVASQSSVNQPAIDPDAETIVSPAAATSKPIPPPPGPAAPEPPVPAPQPRRRAEEEAEPSSGAGKYVLIAGTLAALGLGAYFGITHYQSPAPATAVEQAQTPPAESPVAPPAQSTTAATETAKSKPSPVAPPPAPAPASGEVKTKAGAGPLSVNVKSTPTGARVTFSPTGDPCVSPCSLQLAPGRYVATAALDGYRPTIHIFNVPQETEIALKMDQLSGTLAVKSTPSGAQIFINGQSQGQQTPALVKLPMGRYKLTLKKEGLRDYEEDIQVKDQVTSTIDVNWNQ